MRRQNAVDHATFTITATPSCGHRGGCDRVATWCCRTRHPDGVICVLVLLCETHRMRELGVLARQKWDCVPHALNVEFEWLPL